jgi:signal transduction histidine kinase
MQSVRKQWAGMHLAVASYVSKTLLALFGAMVVLSYGYTLFLSLTTNRIPVARMVMPVIIITVPFVLGWLINKKHPGHKIALFFLIMAYSSAVSTIALGIRVLTESMAAQSAPVINSITLVLNHIMWIPGVYFPLYLIPLYFPTGKLLSPRWRALVVFLLCYFIWTAVTIILHPWPWPAYGIHDTRSINGIPGSELFLDAAWNAFTILSTLAVLLVPTSMFLRFRRSQGVERIQMKWPIAAIIFYLFVGFIILVLPGLTAFDARLGYPMTWILAMLFPISLGVSIVRHRLFDIDIIINRTLVYGGLTGLIVLSYIAIVSGLSAVFHAQNNIASGLLAAVVIATLFQPLREGLQRGVNRLLYGERDDPAAVLTQLAHQLETADAPTDILPNLVQTIAHTLKIPHVAIWVPIGGNLFVPVAVWGVSPGHVEIIPLIYQKETIGRLLVATRSPREAFNRSEQQLLNTIAALTANTVRAVQLSDELRRSRRRIVTAREDERRRLRRDLHDGLGPHLASQTLGLEAVTQLMVSNPEKAQALLNSLKIQVQEAMLDVRRLVYDLRPPALDDLGLVGALEQSASRNTTEQLRFSLDVPQALPELPAAVETAAYRIAQEAMTNVVRHAGATLCIVRLSCTDAHLIVEVRDDGSGLSQNHTSGVGLQAMKERTTELNGQFLLKSLPDAGTLVQARLPLEGDYE